MRHEDRRTRGDNELVGPLAPELDVLGAVAPGARAALFEAWDAAYREVDPTLLSLARRRVADQLGLAPDHGPEPEDRLQQQVAALTDQFVFYAPHVTEELLVPVREDLGAGRLRTFIDALYVLDQTTRLRLSHGRLFAGVDSEEPARRPIAPTRSLSDAISELHACAMRLDQLDPITTEMVRLRAASYHDCKT
jgi:hypothetical protein